MAIIRAALQNPDKVVIEITLAATQEEWVALQKHLEVARDRGDVEGDLVWAMVYRLDTVLRKVQREAISYEESK